MKESMARSILIKQMKFDRCMNKLRDAINEIYETPYDDDHQRVDFTDEAFELLTELKILSKKPLIPTSKEINQNLSSRSAKLRYATRNKNLFSYPDQIYKKFENYLKTEAIQI